MIRMIGNKSKENNRRGEAKESSREIQNNKISPILPAQGKNMFSCQRPMEVLLRIEIHAPQTHTEFLVCKSGHLYLTPQREVETKTDF